MKRSIKCALSLILAVCILASFVALPICAGDRYVEIGPYISKLTTDVFADHVSLREVKLGTIALCYIPRIPMRSIMSRTWDI